MTTLAGELRAQLRQRRQALALSQEDLGWRLGVDAAQVAQWETGARTPRLASLAAWLDVLGCAVVIVVAASGEGGAKTAAPASVPSRPHFSRRRVSA